MTSAPVGLPTTQSAGAQKGSSTLSTVLTNASNQANPTGSAFGSSNIKVHSRGATPTQQRKSPVQEEQREKKQGGANRENRENRTFTQRENQPQGGNRGRRDYIPQGHREQQGPRDQQQQPRGPPRQGAPAYGNQNAGFRGGPQQQRQQNYQQQGQQNQNQDRRGPVQNRPYGQQNANYRPRPNYNRPPRTDVTKLEEYDFEKANQEFSELESKISTLDIEDKQEDVVADQGSDDKVDKDDEDDGPRYDKGKSFFDSISCEAVERSKG